MVGGASFRGKASRGGRIVMVVCVVMLCAAAPHGQQATQASVPDHPSDQQARQAPALNTRVFASDAGIILNFIKPDKTADFEAVMARLKEALAKSSKPERRQQSTSWKIFRAMEPGANGSVLYVFTIDPAVKGADYTVSTILAEAFPNDVQALYKQYAEAYASGQNVVNLKLVSALGQ
jgi:hypothetical protein